MQDILSSVTANCYSKRFPMPHLQRVWRRRPAVTISISRLSEELKSAASSLNSAVDSIDSTMNAIKSKLGSLISIELDDYGDINRRYFKTYDYGRFQDITNILKNLASIVQKIVKVGSTSSAMEPLLTAVNTNWQVLTLGNDIAAAGVWSVQRSGTAAVSNLNELISANGTLNKTESANAIKWSHFLHFHPGFSIPLFDTMTFALDEDAGIKIANSSSVNDAIIKKGGQVVLGPEYTTNISRSAGLMLSQMPFIETVYVHTTWDEE